MAQHLQLYLANKGNVDDHNNSWLASRAFYMPAVAYVAMGFVF
jgi:hypothetical protein